MALFNYQKQVQRLLGDQKQDIFNPGNLLTYINLARGQLAGEGECIRFTASLSTAVGVNQYNFSALNTGVSATNGIQGVIHVRRVSYNLGTGQRWLTPRPWPWFELYHLNNANPVRGAPQTWAQYGQGSAGASTDSVSSGSFYIDPPPNAIYTLNCDCVCYPIALVNDTTVEAIPYLWTDAVPFFASYYALISVPGGAQQSEADRLYKYYSTFVDRARQSANPSVLRWQSEQANDPIQVNKIALPKAMGGA